MRWTHLSINQEIQYYFLFSGFFTELLIKSKLKFHRLFRKTYGIIYERNSDVFIDFFRDLESYYDHGNVREISFSSAHKCIHFYSRSSYPISSIGYDFLLNSRWILRKHYEDFLPICTRGCLPYSMLSTTSLRRKFMLTFLWGLFVR